jgi:hypothetical protein
MGRLARAYNPDALKLFLGKRRNLICEWPISGSTKFFIDA